MPDPELGAALRAQLEGALAQMDRGLEAAHFAGNILTQGNILLTI